MVLLAMVLAGGCGPSLPQGAGEGVSLRVDPAAVPAGRSVTLILANATAGAVGYNLCSSGLERQTDAEWRAVSTDRVCTMELRTLAPGEEARYPVDLESSLGAGSYRFVTNVEKMEGGGTEVVQSTTFEITR